MNIKQRTVLSIGLPLALLAGVISVLFQTHLLKEFKSLERSRLERNVYRVLYAIDNVRDELLLKTVDWGQWDDTYQFIADRNEDFVKGTLAYDTLAAIKVRHALFFNTKRQVVSGQQLDYEKGEIVAPASAELQQIVARDELFLQKSHQDLSSSIMLIGDQYLMVAAVPIVDSKREATPRGTLIFTQPITPELIKKVSTQTQVAIQVRDVRQVSEWDQRDRNALASIETNSKPTASDVNEREIIGYGIVKDAVGRPALLVKIPQERDIYQQGIAVRNYFISGLLLSTVIALLTSLTLFHSAIIKRLHLISDRLAEISATKDFSQRVPVKGKDEISALASDLNSMLNALEEANSRTHSALTSAEHANRSKSTFIAKVSHELRTPIGSIIGMLRILLKQEESEGKRAYISMASSSAYGLLDTINEILDFSKVEAGKLVLETIPFTLREMMREALYAVAPRVEEKEGLELLYDISPDLPDDLVGDPLRLKQCLVNLLGNATKFTAKGSVTVEVSADVIRTDCVEVRFKVSDTGVGIPEDRLSKIFDPFTQADDSVTRVYTGTGLGLTIVKQTIEAMGGSVQVTSTVGTGSTFTLVVPLTRASSMPRAVRCPLPHGAAVAVVDGESAAARFLAKKMERFGLVSEVIASGERSELSQLAAPVGRYGLLVVTSEAIKRSAVFDLVVTCAAEQRMPIVVILSPFEIAARERLVALGVPYLLTRPVSVEDILLSVSGVCEASSCKWQEDQEAALSHARHLKVLVVDDARTNRIILSNMLEDAGHTVKCLENGLDLFNTIQRALRGEEGAEQFDVVLTDVQMPLMDGITATRKIRELESELGVSAALPIFAVTAHAMREETEEMQRSGVNGVVTKPIEPKQLVQALEGIPARPGPGALATFPTNVHDSLGTRASWETIEDLADLVRRVWRRLEIDEKRLVVPEVDDGDWAIEKMLDVQDVYTRVGDSTKRVQLILRVFSESFKDQLTQIVAARSDTDPKELQYAAHAIKGLLLDVGAKQPAAIASLIESMCKRGEAEESKRLITPLSEQVLVVARLIERMLQTLKFEVADDSSRDAHVC